MLIAAYNACPLVLSLKQHKTQAVKNIFVKEKLIHQSTFNPGLALTAGRTTRPGV